ncbi:MIP18 family protein [Neolecta irregularis DAH-3]|uniref:MIP18 family protein n=1 Tax=Neolecta irregularis (strain DAH-3) TaxID=1198029 RepID=A0A1U7LS65_NEOID|nr:MIP18 family protein [Neolecta irregularis DAH-3]|eukprot:OLL25469.1 MIP18 family protein [Neolecta irregularis DAH-3]
MQTTEPQNSNPNVLPPSAILARSITKDWDVIATEIDQDERDPIDAQEIYDLLKDISDPEHPLTLSQLAVVQLTQIYVTDHPAAPSKVVVEITPTIPHCSLATLIGLCIKVRLERALPPRFRIDVKVRKGTHQSENQVNKQLGDKERVAAACENDKLLEVISGMMSTCA